MGPGETFAAIAFAGVAIGMIISVTQIVQRFIAYKEAKVIAQSAPIAPVAAGGEQALEERVRVLERIVTERGFDVAAQIEALRDRPAPPANGVPLNLEKERV